MTHQTKAPSPLGRPAQDFRYVPLASIAIDAPNVRSKPTRDSIQDLARTIKRDGMLQPVVVRPVNSGGTFELLAGRRRCMAAKVAGLKEVPVFVLDSHDATAVGLIENLQRDPITALEEGRAYIELQHHRGIETAKEVAARVGKTERHVQDRIRVAGLPRAVVVLVESGELSFGVSLEIAKLSGHKNQEQAAAEIAGLGTPDNPCTVAKARDVLETRYLLRIETAPFAPGDATLVPAAGSCLVCPKRTSAQAELFPEAAGHDCCRDACCWGTKIQANWIRNREAAESAGAKVLDKQDETRTEILGFCDGGRINPVGPWIDVAQKCLADPAGRPYCEIVEDQKVQLYTLSNERGDVFTVARRGDVQKALKRLGIGTVVPLEESAGSSPDAHRGHETQAEAIRVEKFRREKDRAVLSGLTTAVVHAIEHLDKVGQIPFWIMMVDQTIERAGQDGLRFCLARRGLLAKDESGPKLTHDARLRRHVDELRKEYGVDGLAGLVVELLIGDRMHEGPKVAREWGKALGVDLTVAQREAAANVTSKQQKRPGLVKRRKVAPEPVVEQKPEPATKKRVRAREVKA